MRRVMFRAPTSSFDMARRALIIGITGQDGSYLAELLLDKGYEVHGTSRHSSTDHFERLASIRDRVRLHQIDLLDELSIIRLLDDVRPQEIYNLAAQSFVPMSWSQPVLTGEFTALGVTRVLEAIRQVDPTIRFYQASSSEMFGRAQQEPQDEQTPQRPHSPYGAAKAYGHAITVAYRERYGLFACSGILFNHESPRRGKDFVTRRITHAVARIQHGLQQTLRLGDLEARRDWGFAGDYVQAMWMMLSAERPNDYVVASGVKHSVRDLVRLAFGHVGLDWEQYVESDASLLRPADVNTLCGNASKIKDELGWQPAVDFEGLVRMMVDADMVLVEQEMAAAK